jgi:hypothetical protein
MGLDDLVPSERTVERELVEELRQLRTALQHDRGGQSSPAPFFMPVTADEIACDVCELWLPGGYQNMPVRFSGLNRPEHYLELHSSTQGAELRLSLRLDGHLIVWERALKPARWQLGINDPGPYRR